MADWVTGKVTKVQNWTDALFSLTVHAPINPFTAGQFTKLGLEIDGERVQRAYSYVNAPDNPNLEFYLVTVPQGKLSPRLAALKPGDEVQVVSDASGFFVLDEVPDCETLWMLATGTAIGPYLSILQYGQDVARFKNLVLVHAARFAADLSYLPLMLELQQRYEGSCASKRWSAGRACQARSPDACQRSLKTASWKKPLDCRWIKRPATLCCAGTRRWCAIRSNC